METLGPTLEARQHDTYEPPARDQKNDRTAYRKSPLWEIEFRRGALTEEQFKAAEAFHVTWHGAQGHDMRREVGGVPRDPDYPAREAANDAIRHAKLYVSDRRIWDVLEWFCVEEKKLHVIGQWFLPHIKTRAIHRQHGHTKLTMGLDRVADAWGISQHARAREREPA